MFENNPVCKKLNIKYPIIQGGMVWTSGAKLASAVSQAGGLGLIGAGSMDLETLKLHIEKTKKLTDKPFGVNLPLLYHGIEKQIELALSLGVKIFFTSAGSPKKYTSELQKQGCLVAHVTSTPALAKKCEAAGVDFIVAEGLEAGGHNGREEITTMCLIPQVCDSVNIPVIAAGGIADGRAMAAGFSLGASAVQVGTRFALTEESSLHQAFKEMIINAGPGATTLALKKLVPVRLLDNEFARTVIKMEQAGASAEELAQTLGKGRAKKGMFEGDLEEGELEIGQISGMLTEIKTSEQVIQEMIQGYQKIINQLSS